MTDQKTPLEPRDLSEACDWLEEQDAKIRALEAKLAEAEKEAEKMWDLATARLRDIEAAERERDEWINSLSDGKLLHTLINRAKQAEQRARDTEQAALNAEADLATEKHASAFGLREKDVEIARLRDMLHGEETGFDEPRLLSGDKGIPVSQRPTPPEEG